MLQWRFSLLPASLLLVLHPRMFWCLWYLWKTIRRRRACHFHAKFDAQDVYHQPWIQDTWWLWKRSSETGQDDMKNCCWLDLRGEDFPICCREGNVFLPFVQESFLACMSRFRWLVKFDGLKLNSLKATGKTKQFQTNLFPFRLLLSFDKKTHTTWMVVEKTRTVPPNKIQSWPQKMETAFFGTSISAQGKQKDCGVTVGRFFF